MLDSFGRDIERVGFDIGWNYAAYDGIRLPDDAAPAVKQGYQAGLSSIKHRKPHDRFVRKWLQLHHNAFLRGKFVSEAITPAYLRAIDTPICPVTFCKLSHGHVTDPDANWSVDRINNDGAYADGNLVIMSTRANIAKNRKSFNEVLAIVDSGELTDGLSTKEWARLAVLMIGPCSVGSHVTFFLPQITFIPPLAISTPAQIGQNDILMGVLFAKKAALLQDFRRMSVPFGAEKLLQKLIHRLKKKIYRFAAPPSSWSKVSPFDIWLDQSIRELYGEWIEKCQCNFSLKTFDGGGSYQFGAGDISIVSDDELSAEWHLAPSPAPLAPPPILVPA